MFALMDYNRDITSWDVSCSATSHGCGHATLSFTAMFSGNTAFNQDISRWTLSGGVYFSYMFAWTDYNRDITSWDVSSESYSNKYRLTTNFAEMFSGNTAFNQDISRWNVSRGASFSNMFNGATSFNQPLGGWDLDNVHDIASMFRGATSFNQPLNNWKIGKGPCSPDQQWPCGSVWVRFYPFYLWA